MNGLLVIPSLSLALVPCLSLMFRMFAELSGHFFLGGFHDALCCNELGSFCR